MKIGYLVPEFPSQTHAFFWREIAALERLGHQVTLLSTRRPREATSHHAFTAEAIARTTYLFPPSPRTALWLLRHPGRVARGFGYLREIAGAQARLRTAALLLPAVDLLRATRGLDYLHVHSFAQAAHVAALAQRLGGPPYGLTLHGDLSVYGRDHAAKTARAALITVVTEPLDRELHAALPGQAAQVLSMGVDTTHFSPGTPPSSGPLRIASVARLNPAKGHLMLLAALSAALERGADLRLTIAGEGPFRPEIEAAIAQLGLTAHVELTGALSEAAVLDLLRGSHALALTSHGEGEAAPVAVMEAMACGLAVICSRIGGTADMITDGVDGLLVPQRDVAAITQAILRLQAEPGLRARLGSAARTRAVAQFDHAAKAARLADLIAEAIQDKGGAARPRTTPP